MAVHGTRNRESVSWDYAGILEVLRHVARDHTGLPLLRCYWYEATVEGRRSSEHEILADLPGVKLRLGKMKPGRREGVESEIHRDLTTLARNRAISDALVVSAEDDLAQVIADVQDLGLRVILVHIAAPGWTAAAALRQECDEIVEISEAHLRPSVELVVGAEPVGEEDRQAVPAYANRASANGHGTPGVIGQPALPVGSHAAPPGLYTGPLIAEYQRAAQPPNSHRPPLADAGSGPVTGNHSLASPPGAQPGMAPPPGAVGQPGTGQGGTPAVRNISAQPGPPAALPAQAGPAGQPGPAVQASAPSAVAGARALPGQEMPPGHHAAPPGHHAAPGHRAAGPPQHAAPGQPMIPPGPPAPGHPAQPAPAIQPPAMRRRTSPGRSPPRPRPPHLRPRRRSTLSRCRAAPGSTRARRHGMPNRGQWSASTPSTGCRASSSRRGSRWPGRLCRDSPCQDSRGHRPWRRDTRRPPACPAPRPLRCARACPPTRPPRRPRHLRWRLLRRRWPRRPPRPGTPATRSRTWRRGRPLPCRGRPHKVHRQARPWPRRPGPCRQGLCRPGRCRPERRPSPASSAVCLVDTRRRCPAACPLWREISARDSSRWHRASPTRRCPGPMSHRRGRTVARSLPRSTPWCRNRWRCPWPMRCRLRTERASTSARPSPGMRRRSGWRRCSPGSRGCLPTWKPGCCRIRRCPLIRCCTMRCGTHCAEVSGTRWKGSGIDPAPRDPGDEQGIRLDLHRDCWMRYLRAEGQMPVNYRQWAGSARCWGLQMGTSLPWLP